MSYSDDEALAAKAASDRYRVATRVKSEPHQR